MMERQVYADGGGSILADLAGVYYPTTKGWRMWYKKTYGEEIRDPNEPVLEIIVLERGYELKNGKTVTLEGLREILGTTNSDGLIVIWANPRRHPSQLQTLRNLCAEAGMKRVKQRYRALPRI